MQTPLAFDTTITVFATGLIFFLALCLGVWKYQQMATSETHLAHPYVDIGHRAALLYSFATGGFAALLAGFVVGQFLWRGTSVPKVDDPSSGRHVRQETRLRELRKHRASDARKACLISLETRHSTDKYYVATYSSGAM